MDVLGEAQTVIGDLADRLLKKKDDVENAVTF
jgi:hypothetical protein